MSNTLPKRSKANTVILTLYLLLVCVPSIYLYGTHDKLILLGILVPLTIAGWALSRLLLKLFDRINIRRPHLVTKRSLTIAFFATTAISFAILMVWFIAFFPGSYEPDNLAQIKQVMTGAYDDWHPVWHTLLYYTIPIRIFGKVWSIIVWQMFLFSLALGYMFAVIYEHVGMLPAIISFAYIILNPLTGYILLFAFKDVGFATVALVAVTAFAGIFFDGPDKASILRCIAIGFMLANATLFRHNGVIFTGLMVIAMIFYMSKPKWLLLVASFALTIVVVRGPIYKAVNATVSPTEVVQTVGFPMSVIGNAVKESPDLLDEETLQFAYSYSPAEVWEERYNRGNFNLMKYGGAYNPDVIEEKGVGPIVKMALKCFVESPETSVDAVFALTDFVYGLDLQDKADIDIAHNQIDENDYGLEPAGKPALAGLLEKYHSLIRLKGFNFFRKLGFALLMLVIAVLSRLGWSSLKDWKNIIPCIPIIAYAFGTILLLSGHDARFFYIVFTVSPIVFIMARYDGKI